MKKNIPNILTMFRILLVPVFFVLIFFTVTPQGALWATIVFLIAAITDYFDGLLARHLQVISDFGKIMDPLADKILVLTALLAFATKVGYISIFIFIIIAFREIAVSILREYFKKRGIYIAANIYGKLKTLTQIVGLIFTLLFYTYTKFYDYDPRIISAINVYFWGVAILTIISGMNYFSIFLKKQ